MFVGLDWRIKTPAVYRPISRYVLRVVTDWCFAQKENVKSPVPKS
jgi:hypothetical protein